MTIYIFWKEKVNNKNPVTNDSSLSTLISILVGYVNYPHHASCFYVNTLDPTIPIDRYKCMFRVTILDVWTVISFGL